MKAVQIGILAALVVCAGLLYKVYRGNQPAVQPVAATAAAPATPVPTPAPVEAAPAEPAPVPAQPVAEPAPPPKKPSPTRGRRAKTTEVAANRGAEPPAPAPAAQASPVQLPAPTPSAPAAEPAPAEKPEPATLNPPPGAQQAPPPPRVPHSVTVPAGTMVSVRLSEMLSSDKNQAGDSFSGTLDQPLIVDGFAIAERGAKVQGKVVEATPAGRVRGVSSLAIQLTRLRSSDGQDVALQTETFRKEGVTSRAEDAKKVGVGAAIGAAIGAIAGGGKGAAIGAGVGGAAGAGTVAATRGKPTELPVETRITFRLQEPVKLTERIH